MGPLAGDEVGPGVTKGSPRVGLQKVERSEEGRRWERSVLRGPAAALCGGGGFPAREGDSGGAGELQEDGIMVFQGLDGVGAARKVVVGVEVLEAGNGGWRGLGRALLGPPRPFIGRAREGEAGRGRWDAGQGEQRACRPRQWRHRRARVAPRASEMLRRVAAASLVERDCGVGAGGSRAQGLGARPCCRCLAGESDRGLACVTAQSLKTVLSCNVISSIMRII